MTTIERVEYRRAYSAARQRALARLAREHLGEYAALLAEERRRESAPRDRDDSPAFASRAR